MNLNKLLPKKSLKQLRLLNVQSLLNKPKKNTKRSLKQLREEVQFLKMKNESTKNKVQPKPYTQVQPKRKRCPNGTRKNKANNCQKHKCWFY